MPDGPRRWPCENSAMDFKKILVPVAVVAVVMAAYRFYGWPGVAAATGVVVFWLLLHFNRLMQVLKRAADRPMGYVDSAVMLNAKLKPGMTLMHVIAMTRSLGMRLSEKDAQPEIFKWVDGGDSSVNCTFVEGKLSSHTLIRPGVPDSLVDQGS